MESSNIILMLVLNGFSNWFQRQARILSIARCKKVTYENTRGFRERIASDLILYLKEKM